MFSRYILFLVFAFYFYAAKVAKILIPHTFAYHFLYANVCISVNMPLKMIYIKHQGNKKAESCYEDSASNKKWYHQESNRGHKDFQSFALPTELWHQLI